MRKIINGIAYDTETATLLARGDHDHDASQAWWGLYKKGDGTFFEVAADHDGVIEYFEPVPADQIQKRMERTANHLVEEHFGRMPETADLRFSRATRNASVEVLEETIKTQADLTRLFLHLSADIARRCNDGSLRDRWNHLIKLADENPFYRVDGDQFLSDALVEKAAEVLSREGLSVPEQRFLAFERSMQVDGFTASDGKVHRVLPSELALPRAKDEISRLLTKHGFSMLAGHLDQALDAHGRGNWASANAQLQVFYEAIFDEILSRINPSSTSLGSSESRRQRLASIGCLDVAANEWSSDGKNFVNGLFKRLHPAGSHPGLSSEQDSTFRRHIVLLTARLFLARFDAWPP